MTEKQILDLKLVNDVEALKNDVVRKITDTGTKRFIEVGARGEKCLLAIENNKDLEQKYYAFSKKYFDTQKQLDNLHEVLSSKKKTMLSKCNARIEKNLVLDKSSGRNEYEFKYTLVLNGKRYLTRTAVDTHFDEIEFIGDAAVDARYDCNHKYTQRDIEAVEKFENDFLFGKVLGSSIFDVNSKIKDIDRELKKEQREFKKVLEDAADDIIALKCATVFNNNKEALLNRSKLARYEFDKALGINGANLSAYFENFDEINDAFETAKKLHNINVLANVTTHEWKQVEDFDYVEKHTSPDLPSYLKRENGILYINPALCEFGELSTDLQISTFETAKIVNMAAKMPESSTANRVVESEINKNIWLKDENGKNTVDTRMIANYTKLVNQLDKKQ